MHTTTQQKNALCGLSLLALIASLFIGLGVSPQAYATACGTGNLDTGNVGFRGNASDGCGGVFSGNDSLAAVNTEANNLKFGGTDWLFSLRDDSPGNPGSGSNSFFGLNWTLSVDSGKTGNWILSIADPLPVSLPISIDFLAVLKGGTSWSAYFFDNEVFTTVGSSSGTFNIVFINNGGQIPDISHLTLYARSGDLPLTASGDSVPEPTTVLMLGLGMLGLVGIRRLRLN
ncbi:MAG: PEP-CTERM sorting domain-containing protein [Methylococcaceae bacterium]|jgi:hypothetical protein